MNNAFRSHLMQQFAAAARSQARPPLAMIPWRNDDTADNTVNTKSKSQQKKKKKRPGISTEEAHRSSSRNLHSSSAAASAWSLSTAASGASTSCILASSNGTGNGNGNGSSKTASVAQLSSVAEDTDIDIDSKGHHQSSTPVAAEGEPQQQPLPLPLLSEQEQFFALRFQTLMHTRRTTSHFAPLTATPPLLSSLSPPSSDMEASYGIFWKGASDRAVACGRRAPNHKRTEPFTFQRMLSPSPATERLAEIAYHVTLRTSLSLQQQKNTTSNSHEVEIHAAATAAAAAEKKRDKWSCIPAFLVATLKSSSQSLQPIRNHHDFLQDTTTDKDSMMYEPMPIIPLDAEREMEDYASTCAAVQNVLLSLHAEKIASKWATGPVIRTRAFRELVGAIHPDDRIVALIMIGLPQQYQAVSGAATKSEEGVATASITTTLRPRKFHRDWDDYLQDL